MANPILRSRVSTLLLSACVAALATSCTRDGVDAPQSVHSGESVPLAARTSTALAVTSTNPSFGDQGTTVDVHVFGSGFTSGAKATWLLHGVADDHVHTNNTTFVSSSELVANITIAGDAALDFWDVQVSLSSGKNGVGSECFEVTSAQILGTGTPGGDVNMGDANDLGQAVGYTSESPNVAFVYDELLGIVSVGSGQGWGIDPLGSLAVGRNSSTGVATAWVRQADNTWPSEPLPPLSGSVGGNAASAARAPDGTLIVGGWESLPGAKRNDAPAPHPALWRRQNDQWSPPQLLPIPPGSASASVYRVNGNGQAVGRIDSGSGYGIVWDSPSTFTVLNGTPNSINSAGTIIVGVQRTTGAPVFWWRDPATSAWNPDGVPLPTIAGPTCFTGWARAINAAGVIVGQSCNGGGSAQATVWLLDLSGPQPVLVGAPTPLPGLDDRNPNNNVSSAAAVTEAAPYRVTGGAIYKGTRLAVRWQLR